MDFKNLPTRQGVAQGDAFENRMLTCVGGGQAIRTRIQNNADGSTTMLRTRAGFPEFTTTSANKPAGVVAKTWNMESGAYDLGDIDRVLPLNTPPATNHKSATILAEEIAVLRQPGAARLLGREPLIDGVVSREYTQSTKPGGSLNPAKTTMYQLRPSMFSGLMRRMVQGQYGAGYTDCKSGPRPVVPAGYVDDARVPITNSFGATTGVVKFGAMYVLMKISCSGGGDLQVKAYPLTIPPQLARGNNEHLFVGLSGDALAKAEAALETLALANAKTDLSKEINLGGITIPQGFPIAYGWNFSLTTNTATVVIGHSQGIGADQKLWSRMTIEFSFPYILADEVPGYAGTLQYDLVVDESVDGQMMGQRSAIWVSTDADAVCINVVPTAPVVATNQDFPVYSYFTGDDLHVVRWQRFGTVTTFDYAKWLDDRGKAIWDNSVFGSGTASGEAYQEWGELISHGFTVDGSAIKTQASERRREFNQVVASITTGFVPPPSTVGAGPVTQSAVMQGLGGRLYSSFNPYTHPVGLTLGTTPADPYPGSHYTHTAYQYSTFQHTKQEMAGGGTGKTHDTSLLIPFGDCSSCYIGERLVESGVTTISVSSTPPGRSGLTEYNRTYISDGVFADGGVWGAPVLFQINAEDFVGVTGDITFGAPSVSDSQPPDPAISVRWNGATSQLVSTQDSMLFHASMLTPLLGHGVNGITGCTYGSALYSTGGLTDAEAVATDGYPNTIDAFIGIA